MPMFEFDRKYGPVGVTIYVTAPTKEEAKRKLGKGQREIDITDGEVTGDGMPTGADAVVFYLYPEEIPLEEIEDRG